MLADQGDFEGALKSHMEAGQIFRRLGIKEGIARSLCLSGTN